MRVAICWPNISGYMAACWRALYAELGEGLRVLAFAPRATPGRGFFAEQVVEGLPIELLSPETRADAAGIAKRVLAHQPDVVVIPGWFHRPYANLARLPALSGARLVMTMDTPWTGAWRQHAARLKLRPYLKRFDRVVVAGERTWRYARLLGVPESRLVRGLYGFAHETFGPIHDERRARAARGEAGWPAQFLYTGRYVPDKGLDVLLEAYRRYREGVAEPWGLTCCGSGPQAGLLAGVPGVTDRGFVQPADLPGVYGEHGVFVIASRYEPWGVVLAEAMGTGMPVIASEACGAAVDLVRPCDTGLTVATGEPEPLCEAMRWFHERSADLEAMGASAAAVSRPFGADRWARRWLWMLGQIAGPGEHPG